MLKLCYIDEIYINYLREFDDKIPCNKNQARPYVGIVYKYKGFNYFAPLSSPKPKHLLMNNKMIDIFKIDDGKLGVVNLNNMIPTPDHCLFLVLPLIKDQKYKILLNKQLTYLNNHKTQLIKKTKQFQERYRKGHIDLKIKKRCCNFQLLENKCLEYKKLEVHS